MMKNHNVIRSMISIFLIAGIISIFLAGSVSTNRALASDVLFDAAPELPPPGPDPSPFAPIISVDPTSIVSVQSAELVTVPLTITNSGDAALDWTLTDAFLNISWQDNFDSYPSNSPLHGVGGWKGWFNDPAAGASTSNVQARSTPNSVAIVGASDLVHEYSGYTTGTWTYTTWQYIPSTHSGTTYFIMLNTYNDSGMGLNWSTQVNFDSATHMVTNDGPAGGSLPIIHNQWVEIRLVIDLTADAQTFYYGGNQLYNDSWTDGMSGGGALNIAAVDLFANNASVVYYDDISLGQWDDIAWLSTTPETGTTQPSSSTTVDVNLDATGLALGVYTATLYVESNDPAMPLLSIPVNMTVLAESDLSLTKVDSVDPVKTGELITYTLTVSNLGPQDASEVIVTDTLPAGAMFHHASAGCVEASGVVTCTVGSLANGGSVDLTIVVMAPSTAGVITNTAIVSGNVIDNDLTNNTATEQTTVSPSILAFFLPLINR